MKNIGSFRSLLSNRFIFAALALFVLLAGTAYAGGWLSRMVGASASTPASAAAIQSSSTVRRARARNLALQPEALKFSRRVGRRFAEAGREVSILIGTLSVGVEQKVVRIRRLQDGGGERVEVAVEGGPASLSWDAAGGPFSADSQVDDAQRLLLERLVMDSPDQFALAQLRGASYYTVMRNVRPTDDGGAERYTGPLYDVVRVGEPARGDGKGFTSTWRLYHVNTVTGLVEKIVSEEGGATVEAVLSDWGKHAGETLPRRITWTRGGQVLMELTLNNVTHGPK